MSGSSRLRLHPEAEAEARIARAWYRERSIEVSLRFARSVDEALRNIAFTPARWPVYLGRIRRCVIPRFPYCVYFEPFEDEILVLAIAHDRRRQGYWLYRTEAP